MKTLTTHQKTLASDQLSNAIEVGISYWAEGRNFKRIQKGENRGAYYACELRPNSEVEGSAFSEGDERNDWQHVDVSKIAAAMILLMSAEGAKLCRKDIIEDIRADWNDPDECRSDAETSDVIVQIALFGEVVFG